MAEGARASPRQRRLRRGPASCERLEERRRHLADDAHRVVLGQVDHLVLDVALAAEIGLRRVVRADDDPRVVAGERRPRQLRGVVELEELRRRELLGGWRGGDVHVVDARRGEPEDAAAVGPARTDSLHRDIERHDLLADLERAERVQDQGRARLRELTQRDVLVGRTRQHGAPVADVVQRVADRGDDIDGRQQRVRAIRPT